jgi:ribosomal protein L30E
VENFEKKKKKLAKNKKIIICENCPLKREEKPKQKNPFSKVKVDEKNGGL